MFNQMASKKSKSKTRIKNLSTYMCCVIANLTAIDAVQNAARKKKQYIYMKIYKLALQLNNDWMIENLT